MDDDIQAMIDDCPFAWTFTIIGPIGFGSPRWTCQIAGISAETHEGSGSNVADAVLNAIEQAKRKDQP